MRLKGAKESSHGAFKGVVCVKDNAFRIMLESSARWIGGIRFATVQQCRHAQMTERCTQPGLNLRVGSQFLMHRREYDSDTVRREIDRTRQRNVQNDTGLLNDWCENLYC